MNLISGWSAFYGDHEIVSVGVTFLHLAAVVVGGGAAIAADRAVWRAMREGVEARDACLQRLAAVHPTAAAALIVTGITGVLMFGADLETFLYSNLFWAKMAVLAVLVTNGAWIVSLERRIMPRPAAGWRLLAIASMASMVLWLVLLLLGTWLPVAA
jgi:uncharacterized membrane protein